MTALQPHMLFVRLDCEIRAPGSYRESSDARHSRVKEQHAAAQMALARHAAPVKPASVTVILTRAGSKPLRVHSLPAAFADVRAAVARWIGIDDGSNVYRWVYNQRSQPKERFAELTITWDEAE